MKLTSFRLPDGKASYGIVIEGGLIDAGARLGQRAPTLKSAFSREILDELRTLSSQDADFDLSAVQLLPPIPDPEKIICIGINYHAHIAELGMQAPTRPVVIPRFANSQVGHLGALIRPTVSEQFDYEGELAVVIGTACRAVSADRALDMVGGYACYNDGTVRDWQKHSTQVGPAKNFPASGGFGPWIVTTDEIADPASLTLTTRLNGVVVQQARCDDLIFSVAELIAYCSQFTELVPGDVIVTGTTGGVGAYRKPPLWMKAGDRAEVEISGIGTLINPVRAE